MAFSQDEITAAYNNARASGMSNADIWDSGSKNFGVSQEQFNLASQAYGGASAPAAAAPVASGWEGGRDLTADEISAAKNWSVGKTSQDVANYATNMGLTQKQLGQVYGWSAEDSALGGYGTQTGLDKDRYDYTYDATKGWNKDAKTPPKTGINLSQLQGMTRWDVTPNETVRSQLQQIIADDSPLMQQARARAMQTANTRGLLNSSMAMTAADSAMYDAAMPIAQQDASTYARAGEFNAGQANTFSRDNNAFVRDAYMADFNVGANEWAAQRQWDRDYKTLDRQQQLQLERDAILNGYQSARDQFAAQTQMSVAQLEAASRAASVQPDTSMARMQMQMDADDKKTAQNIQQDNYKTLNAARSSYNEQVAAISTKDLSQEVKDATIRNLTTNYNDQAKALTGILGITPGSWVINLDTAVPAPAPAPTPAVQLPTSGEAGSSGE